MPEKKPEPLIGIVTPVHNNENTIKQTLNSILNQTYKNFLIFVTDDHSTDNTKSIIQDLAKKDSRIIFQELKNSTGAAAARNAAIDAINKNKIIKYVAFLDGDDSWLKNKLKNQVNFMEENKVVFSYGDYNIIDSNTNHNTKYRKSPKKMSYRRMLLGCSVGCLTVMYNKDIVGKITIPNLKKRNDYALWCVILKKVHRGAKYPGILANYSRNPSGISSGNKTRLIKYHYRMHRQSNHFDPFTSSFFTFTNIVNYIFNVTFWEKHK